MTGAQRNHDAFPTPTHQDLVLAARRTPGRDGEMHECRRHQVIDQRRDEQEEDIV